MVTCASIIFGMKRSVTGSNAEIRDVTLLMRKRRFRRTSYLLRRQIQPGNGARATFARSFRGMSCWSIGKLRNIA